MKKSMKTKSFETENLHGKIAFVVQLRVCSQADGVHMTVDTNKMVSITEANLFRISQTEEKLRKVRNVKKIYGVIFTFLFFY